MNKLILMLSLSLCSLISHASMNEYSKEVSPHQSSEALCQKSLEAAEVKVKCLENDLKQNSFKFEVVCGGYAPVNMEISKMKNVLDVSSPTLINNNSICVTVKTRKK